MTGRSFHAYREEIELVCGYISDDQTVANYFGCDRRRVEHIRATMRPTMDDIRIECSREQEKPSSGEWTQKLAAADAEFGSKALRKAIYQTTQRFAGRYGISVEEARHLLLNTGVRVAA